MSSWELWDPGRQLWKPRVSLVAGSDSKESCLQCQTPGFEPWVRKFPWRREWLSTPVFLTGEFQGQRSLAGYSLWGHKESNTTEQLTLSLHFFFLFYNSFRFTEKLNGRCRFLVHPLPDVWEASPILNMPPKGAYLFYTQSVSIRAYSWCCPFSGFGQMYNGMCPLL